jgi:hypothetical protein
LLGPAGRALVQGLGYIAIMAVALGSVAVYYSLPDSSPELFDHLAQAGIGLLVAFSVTLAGIGVSGGSRDAHLSWLGFRCGTGSAALIGVAGCLALSSQASASVPTEIDLLCLAWPGPSRP